jgi:hypothetical protein
MRDITAEAVQDKRDIARNLAVEQKRFERFKGIHSSEMRWLSAAVEHYRTLSTTSHDLIARVREPVFIVGKNNRIVAASPAFLHMAGIKKGQLFEEMPEELEAVIPNKDIEVGKRLHDLVSNTSVVDRFVEVADYFLPDSRNGYHFSMGLQFPSGKSYLADARIKISPSAQSGEQKWRYDGALFEISRPKGMILRNVELLLSHFHNQRAYSMPKGDVTKAFVEKVIKDYVLESAYIEKGAVEDSRYPVLIDFSNAKSVEPEAAKAVVGLYEFLKKKDVEKYFVVPSRLRDLFFKEGLPAGAMMLPEDVKAKDENYGIATEPGLEQGLGQFS